MSRKKKPFFEKVEIRDIGAEGKAIAKVNDKVVFVKMAAPGDVVDLQVTKKRKKYYEARITGFHNYSTIRQEPFCEHFSFCGGCKWQHIPYDLQKSFKQKQVVDALERIAKIPLPFINPIIGSEKDKFYRNKLEFTFSNQRWFTKEEIDSGEEFSDTKALGFHVPGMFNKVVDIHKCWLQEEPSNRIRNIVREYTKKHDYSYYDPIAHKGFLRNLIIRTSSGGEVMVILSFFYEDEEARKNILAHLRKKVPEITSLMYVINTKGNDTLYDQNIIVFSGKDHIYEYMEDLRFKIGPKSFFQTNTQQALQLYRKTSEFADLTGKELVYDLYTGTGTIANFIAGKAQKVVGIESVPEAIIDARLNSEINEIHNTKFYSGDMKTLLNEEFVNNNGRPDVVITDPPRAGMHKQVVEQILRIEPNRIIYVSCNPATQARDLALLDQKYSLTAVQPVDMFPQTHHVENIVKLERK